MRGARIEGIGITPDEYRQSSSGRDPEEQAETQSEAGDERRQRKEKALDKTLADSFPTSDPPSSIPDPGEEDPYAA
jgi:hypothetical protein